jgi:predicted nucleotidyltransferase
MLASDVAAKKLAEYPQVLSAWLFGSRFSGQPRPDSDVDIGLLVSEPLGLGDYLRLQGELSAIFEKTVDLSILNDASVFLQFEAISGRNLYSRDPFIQAGFASRTARDYEEAMAMWSRGLRYRREGLEDAV